MEVYFGVHSKKNIFPDFFPLNKKCAIRGHL